MNTPLKTTSLAAIEANVKAIWRALESSTDHAMVAHRDSASHGSNPSAVIGGLINIQQQLIEVNRLIDGVFALNQLRDIAPAIIPDTEI